MDPKPELIGPVDDKPLADEPHKDKKTGKSNKIILRIGLILGLLLIVGLVYFVFVYSQPRKQTGTQHSNQQAKADPKIKLVQFAEGLPTTTAIVSTKQAGDSRLFVVDRDGIIRIVDKDGHVRPELFLDISTKVLAKDEMGLLGLAFSPNYEEDGNFFVNYVNKNQETVIARYHVSTDSNKADPTSASPILTFKQPYPNHNGGDLLFGQDDYLYVAVGDGGGAGDPENRSQNLNSLFGKILRLDVSTSPYKIPATNPFVGQANTKGEIWDYGLRNPWRMSFDRQTHDLYIADVGQNNIEELDVEPAGSAGGNNYGWRCYEGNAEFNTTGCKPKEQYIFPAFEYNHDDGRCSITGGYVYRGQKYPNMAGKYFYGDFCSGDIFWAEKVNNTWQSKPAAQSEYQISTFGEDSSGELYLTDFDSGVLYKIEDSASAQ